MTFLKWFPMKTAPDNGVYVLVIFEDGDIALARNCGAQDGHNGWWSMDGLDFGYGSSNPVGWLPREALPDHP